MRSRRCLGPGRSWGDAEASGRRVTCKAPSAHVVGGSGRSEASPTATLQDTHSVEGAFSEVELPLYGVLRISHGPRSVIRPIGHPDPEVILPLALAEAQGSPLPREKWGDPHG
jgi:hypothetical protein